MGCRGVVGRNELRPYGDGAVRLWFLPKRRGALVCAPVFSARPPNPGPTHRSAPTGTRVMVAECRGPMPDISGIAYRVSPIGHRVAKYVARVARCAMKDRRCEHANDTNRADR